MNRPAPARSPGWPRSHATGRSTGAGRFIGRTTPLDDTQPIVDTRPSALEALSADQDAHLLHDCLDTLEDRQRESIRTAFFDGLTYAQLAERQNTPLGTVKSWVRRGLMKLRECLEQ
jgi:RNA polymerase sigma factor (sigma-70 family)